MVIFQPDPLAALRVPLDSGKNPKLKPYSIYRHNPQTLNPKVTEFQKLAGIQLNNDMDHIAALEQQMVSERLRRKLEEVNTAAQTHLSPVQDHINFTLQVYISSGF